MINFYEQHKEHLIPVALSLDSNGKKSAQTMPWKNNENYKKFNSRNSIGMRTGSNTANVVDIDTKDFSKLTKVWRNWVEDRLMFEDTLIVETANGYHFYFKSKKLIRSTAKTDAKGEQVPFVDFRGEGGLIFVQSSTDFANYKVICDEEPMSDMNDILALIPEYKPFVPIAKPEVVGFDNLDDESDKDTYLIAMSGKKTLDEVIEQINLTSAGVTRKEWMELIASAYNIIDFKPDRLKEPLRAWSKERATDEHPYEDSAFELVWNEVASGKFGTAFKGGFLVKEANKGRIDGLKANVGVINDINTLEELAEKIQSSKMSHTDRDEFVELFCTKSKELTGKPSKVKWKKALKFLDKEKAKQRQEDAKNGMPDYVHTEKGIKYLNTFANLKFFVEHLSEHNFFYDTILKRTIVDNDYSVDIKLTVAFSLLSDELTRYGLSASTILAQHFEPMTLANTLNPLIKHIEELPAWDGETDFIGRVASTLTTELASTEYTRAVIESFVVQAVAAWDGKARTPQRLSQLEQVLTFVGSQGAGKTTWVGELMPNMMTYYFKNGVELDPSNKDSLMEAVSAGLVELGELDATTRKSDIASLKAFLSNTIDEFRAPYGRFAERYTRRTVFVGTVNSADFLKDATGSRRFLVLDVKSLILPLEADVEGMWAQALALYLAGNDWKLPESFKTDQTKLNKIFTDVGEVGDVAEAFKLAVDNSVEKRIKMSVTKITSGLNLKLSPRERSDFANALNSHGIVKYDGGKFYLPSDVFEVYRTQINKSYFEDLTIDETKLEEL